MAYQIIDSHGDIWEFCDRTGNQTLIHSEDTDATQARLKAFIAEREAVKSLFKDSPNAQI